MLRSHPVASWMLLVLFSLLGIVGCSADPTISGDAADAVTPTATPEAQLPAPTTPSSTTPSSTAPSSTTPSSTVQPSATPTSGPAAQALPPAPIGFDALGAPDNGGPRPVSISIETIAVQQAVVVSVGVNEDLSFEVPPADLVGWYEFGPRPGGQGSAVLAAHVAYDGIDGVFRYLADVEPGAIIGVAFDDGSSSRYKVTTVTDYVKEELPDSLFAQSGDPQLALITCGGAFNPELRSFDSNTVVVAVPL